MAAESASMMLFLYSLIIIFSTAKLQVDYARESQINERT